MTFTFSGDCLQSHEFHLTTGVKIKYKLTLFDVLKCPRLVHNLSQEKISPFEQNWHSASQSAQTHPFVIDFCLPHGQVVHGPCQPLQSLQHSAGESQDTHQNHPLLYHSQEE